MSKQKKTETTNMEKQTDSSKSRSAKQGKLHTKKVWSMKHLNMNFGFLRKGTIKTKVITGFSIVAAALIIMGIINLYSVDSMDTKFTYVVQHDAPVIENARQLAKLVVDMETGQRGFIITGNEEFLDPYTQGIKDFDELIQEEIVLVSDNPGQVERLRAIQASVKEWLTRAAIPEIDLASKVHAATVSEGYLQDLLAAAVGKGILDNLRIVFDELNINFQATSNMQGELVVSYLAKDMVDKETGQRGFLITGNEEFLEPYFEGSKNFINHMSQLRTITRTSATNRALAEKVQLLASEWSEKAGEPEIAARREMNENPETMQDVSLVLQGGTGKDILDRLREQFKEFTDEELRLTTERYDSASATSSMALISMVFIILGGTIISMLIGLGLADSIAKPIGSLKESAEAIAGGDLEVAIEVESTDEVGELAVAMTTMRDNISKANKISEDQNWLLSGTSIIAEQVKGEKELSELTEALISKIIPHLNGQMGAFYASNGNGELNLSATYAYDKRNQSSNRVKVGEGLIGQAAAEKKSIIFRDVPTDYFNINSGLGKVTPRNVMVFPVLFQNQIKGVIEIATVHDFTDLQLEFVNSTTEAIGIAMNTAQARGEVNRLLKETQDQAKELQASEEELRAQQEELLTSNNELEAQAKKLQASEEELKTQQEELVQSNQELEEKSTQLEEKNQSINDKNQELEYSRTELENQAKQLEITSKYKSEFLANMSHELRTPLNSILLLSKLLSDNNEGNLTDDQIEHAQVVNNSGNSLLELINEILDLSKIESGKMDVHIEEIHLPGINKSLLTTFDPQAAEKRIKLNIEFDENSPVTITSDKQRLEQVLKNLLSNAIKFTEKGNVSLKIFVPADTVRFTNPYLIKENVVAFEVTDTGIGISQSKQQTVFEAFQQEDGSTRRKYGGTGLGLSLSRMIAKMLGGEIVLESTKGLGSTFTLYLPVNGTEAIDYYSQGISETKTTKEAKTSPISIDEYVVDTLPEEIPDDRNELKKDDALILIVEDDTSVAKVLLKFVRDKGYKGIVAVSGDKAIDYTRMYNPFGILLDIKLPVKSGWTVMQELKQNKSTRHIPVHIMSSLEAKKESLKEGAIDFSSKPVSQKQIETALDKIEQITKDYPKHILVIDANKDHQAAMASYIGNTDKICIPATSAKKGMSILAKDKVDCVVLDMALPDANGYELMESIRNQKQFELLPIIVYTGKSLSINEEQKIRRFASTIIVKTAESYERLLDEISLFLHLVEEGKQEKRKENKPYLRDTVLQGRKVLVVDDDIRNIFSLTKLMESHKMEVLSASNGKEGLKEIQQHRDLDIVLMDMMMPEMDGYDTIKKIRKDEQFEKLPIIAVTAKAMLGDRDKCIKAGASDYISKPVDADQLLSLLRVWLYKS